MSVYFAKRIIDMDGSTMSASHKTARAASCAPKRHGRAGTPHRVPVIRPLPPAFRREAEA
jgi:hypothetical protein